MPERTRSKGGMPPAEVAVPVLATAASGGASAERPSLQGRTRLGHCRESRLVSRPPSARPWPVPWQWAWTAHRPPTCSPLAGSLLRLRCRRVRDRPLRPRRGILALAVRRREEELVLVLGGGGAGRARAGTERPHERENASDDPLRLPHVVDAPLVVPVCGNTLGALEERKPLTLVPNAPARFNMLSIVPLSSAGGPAITTYIALPGSPVHRYVARDVADR